MTSATVNSTLIGNIHLELLMVTSFTYRAVARWNDTREFIFETEEYRDPDVCWNDAIAEAENIIFYGSLESKLWDSEADWEDWHNDLIKHEMSKLLEDI